LTKKNQQNKRIFSNDLSRRLLSFFFFPQKNEFLTDRELRLYAIENTKDVRKYIPENELEKFDAILDVITKYANGNATEEERESAWASARESAWESAWASALASAWASARESALESARASALESARESAWASAWASARESALESALESAWASAWASARESALESARASAYNLKIDRLYNIFKQKELISE
jgi:hypothetical protein